MCGIAGMLNLDGRDVDPRLLTRMGAALAHRGPDGSGTHADGPLGLAHRRLAILDLSEAGRQPMSGPDGTVLVYNGEIYNFRELRDELTAKGRAFTSGTDTEVILHAYDEWGIDCVKRFNGIFAFALWDAATRTGFLVRDRFGVKPLYIYRDERRLLFASEIKGILAAGVEAELDMRALGEYFTFQNILSDRTLFAGIRLLPPATIATFTADSWVEERFWQPPAALRDPSPLEAVRETERLFAQAVERQLVADVPVASYLSGGMDSGSITAVAARSGPLRTYTCGFSMEGVGGYEHDFDERAAARVMAQRFATEHAEREIGPDYMERTLTQLVTHLEDIRLGMSFPNYAAAELVATKNKVVLSGSGGDELFGGYPWRYRHALGGSLADSRAAYKAYWERLIPAAAREEFFTPEALVEIGNPDEAFDMRFTPRADVASQVQSALLFEFTTFLHGLFIVEDKLSMAHGVEARVPFLDNELVDFALALHPRHKLADYDALAQADPPTYLSLREGFVPSTDGKQVLRQAMAAFIPARIANGKKQGFSAPVGEWFRNQARPFVERTLLSERAQRGIIRPEAVKRLLDEHNAGADHRLLIWSLLCFEYWCRVWLDDEQNT